MKRKIALIVIMILALSLLLAACTQPAVTAIRIRWDKEETHVFNITLADFANEQSSSDPFNYYYADGSATTKTDSNKDLVYSKDIAFSNEFRNWDEVKPLAVGGTYTLKIIPATDASSSCVVETKQVIYAKYNLKTDTVSGVDFGKYSELRNAETAAEKTAEEYRAFGLTKGAGETILKSTVTTTVTFENVISQKPLSSSVTVNGFYVGTENQNITKYSVSTEYVYEKNKKPVAKITMDGNTTEYTFPKNSEGKFIDSNQILTYLRSLDKSASFQDSPSISVFNPYTKSLQKANFGLVYDYKVLLTDNTRDNPLATNLSVVSVTVGNNSFMMQENLTNKLADKELDVFHSGSKYTTVRFRVGYLAYEIDYANAANTTNWNDIWTALSPVPTPEEE